MTDPLVSKLWYAIPQYPEFALATPVGAYEALARAAREQLIKEIKEIGEEWDAGADLNKGSMPIDILIGRLRGNGERP